MADQTTHIYLNPVAADRSADFEKFLRDIVEPVLQESRPDLVGKYRYLKATQPDGDEPAVVTYAFIFDGGDLDEDWELNRLLSPRYGDEEAERLLDEWGATFIPLERWLAALGGRADGSGQVGWTFEPVEPTASQVD